MATRVVLDAMATDTLSKRYRKKKLAGRPTKMMLYMFFNKGAKALPKWKEVNHRTLLGMRHSLIGATFLMDSHIFQYKLHHMADKANLNFCKWPITKKWCVEICQYIYNIIDVEGNEVTSHC